MKQSFYGRLRSLGYDIGTDVSEIMTFYIEHWKRVGRPEPVLEPMCGTGLNLVWFLREGGDCDGSDASSHMLNVCRDRLKNEGLQARLFEQKIEETALERQYAYIYIPGGSLGHVYDTAIALEALKRLRRQLRPGGWFVVDVRTPAYMTHFGKDGEHDCELDEFDGATIFTTGYWQHLDKGRVIRKWNKMERFENDTLTEVEIFDYRERMFERNELHEMLTQAGFGTINVMKAYEFDAQPAGDDGMVFVCQSG